jgi:hypothetical protein
MAGVQGTVLVAGVTYKYAELSFGKNRGIMMSAEQGATGNVAYQFNPNPHNADSKWYNKHQEAFYEQAATAIAQQTIVNNGNATYPAFGTQIDVHGVDYSLNER